MYSFVFRVYLSLFFVFFCIFVPFYAFSLIVQYDVFLFFAHQMERKKKYTLGKKQNKKGNRFYSVTHNVGRGLFLSVLLHDKYYFISSSNFTRIFHNFLRLKAKIFSSKCIII